MVCGKEVKISDLVKYLGAWFDSMLTFKDHVTIKCKSAMWVLKQIKMIRNSLDRESTKTLECSLVISHLEYANGNLFGISELLLDHMQRVQNFAARIILRENKNFSSRQALYELHWLPIHAHIIYKMLSIVFNCLNDANTPVYLRTLLVHNNCVKKKGL